MTDTYHITRLGSATLGIGALANVKAFILGPLAVTEANPQFQTRPDAAPSYTQSGYDASSLTARFVPDPTTGRTWSRSDRAAVLRALDWPNPRDPRELIVTLEGGDGEFLACRDVIAASVVPLVGQLEVTFASPNLAWRACEETATPTLTLTESAGAVAVLNPGHVTVQPEVEIGWTVQRDAGVHSPLEGWRYVRRVAIENETDRLWEREPWCVDLGDTAALVSGSKALTNGDDVRVWHEGKELPRTLVNWGSTRGMLWFVATIPDGETATFDIVYGNPSAATPTTVSTKTGTDLDTYIAYDLGGFYGVADSGGASTLVDAAANTTDDDRWNGGYIHIISGTGAGQARRILDFTNSTGTFTVGRAWTTNPAAGSVYVVWRSGIAMNGGQASAGTASSLTDASAAFGTEGQWVGGTLHIIGGTRSGESRTILSHTNTVLTTNAFGGALDNTSVYRIERYGAHTYAVNESAGSVTHRGGWRINRYYSQPGDVWFGDKVPGGWQPITYLPNDDDFAQTSFIDLGSYAGHTNSYWPILDAWRVVRQDAALPEEGQADGVSLYDPRGFQAIAFDYLLQNEEDPETGDGIGRFTFAAKGPGGGNWEDLVTDTDVYATFTTVNAQWVALNEDGDGGKIRLYMGMLPADGVVIPNRVSVGSDARVRWNTLLQTHLALDGIGGLSNSILSWGSEVDVYQPAHVIRSGGGHEPRPPYVEATLNRVLLEADQTLRLSLDVDSTEPMAAIWEGGEVVEETPWAVTFERVDREVWQVAADDVRTVAQDLLPIAAYDEPMGTELLTSAYGYGTFETDLTGWATNFQNAANVTLTRSRVTSPTHNGSDGAYQVECTANTAVGTTSVVTFSDNIAVTAGQVYRLRGWVRQEQASPVAGLTLAWYTSGVAFISSTIWAEPTAATDEWIEIDVHATAPATAGIVRIGLYSYQIPAGTTFVHQFDDITLRPTYARLPNRSFEADIEGWDPVAITGGVTVAWAQVSTPSFDKFGSMRAVVSAAPASSWQTAIESDGFAVSEGERLDVAFAYRSTVATFDVAAQLNCYDAGGALIGTVASWPFDVIAANTWYTGAIGGILAGAYAESATVRLKFIVSGPSSTTGTFYLDAIDPDRTVLHIEEAEPGTTTVAVSVLPRYLE